MSIKVYGVLAIRKGKIEMNDTNPKPAEQKPNRKQQQQQIDAVATFF